MGEKEKKKGKEMNERNRGFLKGFVGATIAAIVIASAFAVLPSGMNSSPDKTVVSIDPSSQNVSAGETFTVNITINPWEPIAGAQADLLFNPSLIQAKSVSYGGIFGPEGFPPGGTAWFINGTIDNTNGTIRNIVASYIGTGGITTPGVFAIIEFTAGSISGTSSLNLTDVIVGGPSGEVPIMVNNGSVTVVGVPDIVPPEISNVEVTQSIQVIGGWVNITCTVTDNVEVDIVKVNVSDPNGNIIGNFTMTGINLDPNGNGAYYYNSTYSIEGTYDYSIWANDPSGNEKTSPTYHFQIKSLIINSPTSADPAYVRPHKRVGVTCTFYVGNVAEGTTDVYVHIVVGEDWASPMLYNIPENSIQTKTCFVYMDKSGEGTWDVHVDIDYDSIHYEDDSESSVIVDDTPPVVPDNALTIPNGGENWAGGSSQNITWNNTSITDDNLGDNPIGLYYSIDSTWTEIATNLPNDGTYSWAVPVESSTSCRIKIVATDLAGKTASDISDANFTIDSTKPSVIYYLPTSGWYNNDFEVEANVTDAHSGVNTAHYRLENITNVTSWLSMTLISGTDNWTATFDIDLVSDGSYTIRINATDYAGNYNDMVTAPSIGIDTKLPEVTSPHIIYPSGQSAAKNGDMIELNATVYDATSGIDTSDPTAVRADVSGINDTITWLNLTNIVGTNYYTATIKIDTSNEGSINCPILAKDKATNENTTEGFIVIVDDTNPTIEITEPTQSNPTYIKNGTKYWVNFTYVEENPYNYTVKVWNETLGTINITTVTPVPPSPVSVNFTLYANEGWYNVTVTMYDSASNSGSATQERSLLVDNTNPPAPTNLTAIEGKGIIELSWDPVSDSGNPPSGINYYSVYWSVTPGAADQWLKNVYTNYATINATDGATVDVNYNFTVTATDRAGNEGDRSDSSTATYKEGVPYKISVTASPTTVVANGTSQSTITAKTIDEYGNPCTTDNSTVIAFTVDGPGVITGDKWVVVTNGVATTKLNSTTNTGIIKVSASSGDKIPGYVEVKTIAGPSNQLYALDPPSAMINTNIMVTIEVQDQYGNLNTFDDSTLVYIILESSSGNATARWVRTGEDATANALNASRGLIRVNVTDTDAEDVEIKPRSPAIAEERCYPTVGTFTLVDTTPPEITNVEATPDPQEVGGYVNITCDVTDNVAVGEVWVNITYPDSTIHNFSMNPGSYYFNQTYTQLGIYNYFIWANDTSGNRDTSTGYSFVIKVEYPPWDIDQDGKVDGFDLNLVAWKYGKTGTPGWIPEDFTGSNYLVPDGKVDGFDLNLVAYHYEK